MNIHSLICIRGERDPRRTTLVTAHVTLKSKLQLGGENNVATKLIKMGAISSAILPTETHFFPFFFQFSRIKLDFASAERTKAQAQSEIL